MDTHSVRFGLWRRGEIVAFVSLMATLAPTTGSAFDLFWNPQAAVKMRLDDNVRGSAVDPVRAWGFDNGAGVQLMAKSETWTSELSPRFNVRRFAIGDNLDADEYSVDFKNGLSRERWHADLDVRYAQDSTLTAEATETGVRNDVTYRDTVEVQPNISYQVNEKTNIQAAFAYDTVSFAKVPGASLIDYQYQQASLTLNRALDNSSRIFASPFVSEFVTQEVGGKTRTYGGQVGYTRAFSPTFEADMAVGFVSSEIRFREQQVGLVLTPSPHLVLVNVNKLASSSGPIVNASFRKKFDQGLATLAYSRQISPSARGSQSISDLISLSMRRDLSQRWWLNFNGTYEMRGAEGDRLISALSQDRTNVSGSVQYRLSEQLTVRGVYRHTMLDSGPGTRSVSMNGLFLELQYNGGLRPYLGGY
ncbi:MAG: hypothetical protein HY749_18000 [Gammaproteobacteria bacterium]|nr:hypothetical protein [Gammaproteobacteria bacterium]